MASIPDYVSYPFFSQQDARVSAVELVQNKDLYVPLAQADPEVQNIIDKETWRQFSGLELIASEVSLALRDKIVPMVIEARWDRI